MLNKDIVDSFIALGHEKEIENLKEVISFHSKYFLPKIVIKEPRSTIHDIFFYLQCSIYRSQAYVNGYINALNDRNILMVALAVRAHLEITASLGFLLKKIDASPTDIKNAIDDVNKLILGYKHKGFLLEESPRHDSINVMTMIDASDFMLKKFTTITDPLIRNAYIFLSEFCHPNAIGVLIAGRVSEESMNFSNLKEPVDIELFLPFHRHFELSTDTFKGFHMEIFKIIYDNTKLPKNKDNNLNRQLKITL